MPEAGKQRAARHTAMSERLKKEAAHAKSKESREDDHFVISWDLTKNCAIPLASASPARANFAVPFAGQSPAGSLAKSTAKPTLKRSRKESLKMDKLDDGERDDKAISEQSTDSLSDMQAGKLKGWCGFVPGVYVEREDKPMKNQAQVSSDLASKYASPQTWVQLRERDGRMHKRSWASPVLPVVIDLASPETDSGSAHVSTGEEEHEANSRVQGALSRQVALPTTVREAINLVSPEAAPRETAEKVAAAMTLTEFVSPGTLEQQMLRASDAVPETQADERERAQKVAETEVPETQTDKRESTQRVAETESDEEVLVVFAPPAVTEPETRVLTDVEENRGCIFQSDGQHRYKRVVTKKAEMLCTRAMKVGDNHEESKYLQSLGEEVSNNRNNASGVASLAAEATFNGGGGHASG